jgi:ABC-type multidrug transport system fused ATPase/permease subunit
MKIEEASVKSHSKEFIMEMDRKYDSVLGDQGVNISGGQRQRITMAREFYKDSPVLILDEATSSLDSATEQMIQESIDRYKHEKTMIIIAHRLSTIKHCDKIFVLNDGLLIEEGSYEELYHKDGIFREMIDRQTLK